MLASKYRLSSQKDIDRAKKSGRVFQSTDFGMTTYFRDDENPSRFVVVTSKKVTKFAAERNRIKRIFHDTVRYELTRIKPGYDVVFLTKRSILRYPTDQIMLEIKSALKNTKLFK